MIQIWEQPDGLPKPATAQEACSQAGLAARRHEPAWPNARLKDFQRQILERWPITEETDWEGKRQVDLGVWQDESLRADLGDAPLLALTIATSLDRVLGWLAEAGPRAGVSVCDAERGHAWLADGSVWTSTEKVACLVPLGRLAEADDGAAWEQFVALAARGNREAVGHLATMYVDGRWVGRDPAIVWALKANVRGWRVVDGAAAPPAGTRPGIFVNLEHDRGQLDAAACARADALLARLGAGTSLREALLAAAHEFDARFVAARALIDDGQVAAATLRLQPMADRGHGPSRRALAHLWSTGRATPEDPKQELGWITAAADAGDTAAYQRLAWLYDEGVLRKRSARDARGVYRFLVKRGGTAAVRDAARVEYKRLIGPPTGKFWTGRSESELLPLAEQGDAAAMVELARLIEWGRSLNDVWERSTPWWIRAAEAGDALAQRTLASFHEQGRGVPKDEARAAHWYGLSARQGDGHAQVEYARRLGKGQGLARDDAQARQWLERAVRQRIPEALRILARSLANGDLYPKDLLAAQVVIVIHDRMQDWGCDDFHGPDQADPREVRRLLAEIDSGAELLDVLARRAASRATAASAASAASAAVVAAGRLSLAPMAASAAPAAPRPAVLAPVPAAAATSASALASRRRERVVEPEPEAVLEPAPARSVLGPVLILLSFAVLAAVVAALRKDADAHVTPGWLLGSAFAAAGAYRMSREGGNAPLVAVMDAVPMFVPFVGSALAARMLYFRWRPAAS